MAPGGVLEALSCHLEGRSHRKHRDEWAPLGTGPACDPGAGGTSMLWGKRKPLPVQGLLEVELGGLEPPTS